MVKSELSFDHRADRGRRGQVALAMSLGIALMVPTARAEDARAAAKRKLVEGSELLRAGDYPSALACFQAAHDLVPSSKIEYNLGVAYMRLARNAEALAAFDAYLRETLDASASSLNKARAYREDLTRKVARLVVRADVDGASIGIDGRPYGTTPRDSEIVIDAGAHLLLVEEPGTDNVFSRSFVVPPGGSLTIEAKLPGDEPAAEQAWPPLVATEPAPAANPPRWLEPAALVAGGLAVAALGIGAYEWTVKEQRYGAFNDSSCSRRFSDNGGSHCSQLLAEGDQARRLGVITLGAGVALGAMSAGLFVWKANHAPAPKETALACAPTLTTPGGACQLRF